MHYSPVPYKWETSEYIQSIRKRIRSCAVQRILNESAFQFTGYPHFNVSVFGTVYSYKPNSLSSFNHIVNLPTDFIINLDGRALTLTEICEINLSILSHFLNHVQVPQIDMCSAPLHEHMFNNCRNVFLT
ncbi:hypothetical protein KP509_05G072800 [Ceratopteris richardii]|uniref:Uncharacterized protein n=1 Tax=Ceratopteris richardii TaxID=49495 RepID=A0A8T2UMS6_CERRI|nr:hypothetical protein KP509_05G072800 [Ceratopteris richardii]